MFEHFPFLAVFFALAALTIAPGMDTVMVLRNGARGGFLDGLMTSLGICSGLFVHAVISALGLSVILLQSALLFALLKYIGALFLIYLAVQSLRAAWRGQGLVVESDGGASGQSVRCLPRGIAVECVQPQAHPFLHAIFAAIYRPDPICACTVSFGGGHSFRPRHGLAWLFGLHGAWGAALLGPPFNRAWLARDHGQPSFDIRHPVGSVRTTLSFLYAGHRREILSHDQWLIDRGGCAMVSGNPQPWDMICPVNRVREDRC